MVAPLLALAAVALLIFQHPFLTYPLSLWAIRLCRRPSTAIPDPGAESATFAICFCAYNEEHVIEAKIENLLELRKAVPNLEILVYVDAATDRTAELLRHHADHVKIYESPKRCGKSYGMNLLLEATEASIIIFTDATVMLDPGALTPLSRYFADPRVGCVCGHLVYANAAESVTAATGALYWRLEERIKQFETDTGSTIGADGSIFAIRRRLHLPVPDHIIDDMFLSLSILCDGYRVIRAPDIMAYENSATSEAEESRRKIRIACQGMNVHRLLWPRLRRLDLLTLYKYVSHKLLRWFSIYTLTLAAIFFEAGLVAAGMAVLALALAALVAAALYAGRTRQLWPLSRIWSIFVALCATGFGVWLSLRGEKFQIWAPAPSIRR
jgi:cellulose synthase/poly-beta-1,6-N-acetylglucosamine synthase-like glycosyltransferase